MQGLLETEQALAVHGTFLHMVNHSLIKLVLFMAAGVIYMNTHALNLNEIRGFGRNKPLFKGIFLTGALAIAGIPFFSGYISKTLLHESIVEFGGGMPGKMIEILFLISGGLTVAYMTKLYVAVFVEENTDSEKQKSFDETEKFMNRESGFALAASAVILLIWGLFPHSLMDRAATYAQSFMNLQETGERVSYFAPENLLGMVISVGIGAAVYVDRTESSYEKDGKWNGTVCRSVAKMAGSGKSDLSSCGSGNSSVGRKNIKQNYGYNIGWDCCAFAENHLP